MSAPGSGPDTPDGDGNPEPEPRGNDGIVLSGGPVTNTGAIVAGEENRVTVRRTGSVRRAGRGGAPRANPLVNTGGLVSGAGHDVGIEETGDVDPVERFDHGGGPVRGEGAGRADRGRGDDPADPGTRHP